MRAEFNADRAAADVKLTSLQAQLEAISTALAKLLPPATRPTTPPPVAPLASFPASTPPSVAPPACHRQVLAPSAVAASPVNPFHALAEGDSDDDEHEEPLHSHTRSHLTAVLPAAFAPTPSGTEKSAQQQLSAIVSGLSKQGAKVKYANVAQLNEALDDWAADSLRAGWCAARVESIRAYQRQLVYKFSASERRPLKEVLDYHRKWCKAVHNGTINMFAPGAELNLHILYDVSNPQQFGATGTSASSTPRAGKPRSPASAAAPKGTARGSPAAGKHPAVSCTDHPTSTSHTTTECLKK